MANIKTIRKRITGIKNTRQLTKAMKMVAAAKLRRAQMRAESTRPYNKTLTEMIQAVAGEGSDLSPIAGNKRACLVFASDRGLCGSYNNNVIRDGLEYKAKYPDAILIPFCKKAVAAFEREGVAIPLRFEQFYTEFAWENVSKVINELFTFLKENEVGTLEAVYTAFISAGSQKLTQKTLFPFAVEASDSTVEKEYVVEPDREQVLEDLVEHYARFSFYSVAAEVIASEHGARMTAMDLATRNAGDMIDRLTLEMNRARQASITKELLEIIAGAEAIQ